LRLIGHRDLMRCFERLFRRAGLALSFSEGFHPKPRMTFPLALAVGIEGIDEVMEIELAERHEAEELMRRLSPQAPPGLAFRKIEILPDGARKAQVESATYEASVPPECSDGLDERIGRFMAADSCAVERGHGRNPIDVRPLISELWHRGETLGMKLRVNSAGSAGPREVLAALGMSDAEHRGARLSRTVVEVSQ
jgi:radical SAM-linked protein